MVLAKYFSDMIRETCQENLIKGLRSTGTTHLILLIARCCRGAVYRSCFSSSCCLNLTVYVVYALCSFPLRDNGTMLPSFVFVDMLCLLLLWFLHVSPIHALTGKCGHIPLYSKKRKEIYECLHLLGFSWLYFCVWLFLPLIEKCDVLRKKI